eukprot:58277_1
MPCAMHIILYFLFQSITSSSFHPLSHAGLRDEVVKYLPLSDIHLTVSRINRETYKAIGHELKAIKIIETIIGTLRRHHAIEPQQLETISNLTQQLKLSELFILRRHSILTSIIRTLQVNANQRVRSMYFAFNAHTITISEYQQLTFPNLTPTSAAKAKLLVLSSRVSAPVSLKASSLNLSMIIKTHQIEYRNGGEQSILSNFPWFYQDQRGNVHCITRRHYYFKFIFDFVFTHYHKDLKIPKLSAIFRPEIESIGAYKKEIKNLIEMIDQHQLFLHHPRILHQNMELILRDEFGYTPCVKRVLIRLIIGADLTNTFIFDQSVHSKALKNDVMTAFVLHLYHELVNSYDHLPEECELDNIVHGVYCTVHDILIELMTYHYKCGRADMAKRLDAVVSFLRLQG